MCSKEKCFYCGVKVVVINDDMHYKTSYAKSPDHFFPRNHPLYDSKRIVMACVQCNLTKGSGDPIEFIKALKDHPLPVWGNKYETKSWCKMTGYKSMKYNRKNG